uniref:Uncharacterized protein n=1 Tax=Heliothis virescens TaxID=7102 RepID=A0A2A4JGE1_HELVI
MPPLFHMDNYEECLQDPDGLYCITEIALVSDEPSPLLTMIQDYSAHWPAHYNRTLLRHGICVTKTCKQFYDNSEGDLGSTLEACANESLYNNYKLKAKVSNAFDCSKREKSKPLDIVHVEDPAHTPERDSDNADIPDDLIISTGVPSDAFFRETPAVVENKMVGNEIADCRRNWWRHLLYINNYYYDSECMVHSWYLAADMQLYITALVVFLACRTPRVRKVTLSVLFVVATVVPALHTYHQKLDGVLVVYPEFLVKIFMDNPTFDFIYKRGHTNLIGYVVGMSMGYMVYAWQKAGGDPKNLRKYRFIYWTLFPMGCLCCYTGRLYYTHAPPPNMFIDIMFAAFMKPVFSIVIGTVIVGVVIQFENLYWSAVAWRGWTIPSRLSFSAYLLHIGFARNNVAAITTVSRTSLWMMLLCALRVTIVSFISAIVFWLMVETPLNNVVKEFFSGQKAIKEDKTEPSVDKHEHIEDKIAKDTSEILEKIENNNVFMRKRLVRSS